MRHPDWASRLAHTIKAATERPFLWGEFDCCLFVADCCVAVCGVDPAESYRSRYRTEIGAKRALLKNHGSVEEAFDAYFERMDVAFVMRGDIVTYLDAEGLTAAAVCWAGGFWAALRDGGVGQIDCVPLVAWRVDT